MSDDTDFTFDTTKAKQQVESLTSSLDRLMAAVNRLDKTELSKIQQQMDAFASAGSTAAGAMGRDVSKAIENLNRVLSVTGRQDYGIVKDIRSMQVKAKEELKKGMDNMGIVYAEFKNNTRTAWQAANATATAEAARLGRTFTSLSTLATKNVGAVNLDNFFPPKELFEKATQDRVAMYRRMFDQIAEETKQGATKAKLVAGSATPMNIDETRRMFGLPDRNEMKTLAAQLKGQMQESLTTEKLRTASASSMSLDETRNLFGLPDRNEMKTFAAQIKSQMQEALSTEKLRAKSATAMSLDDTRSLLGLPSKSDMDRLRNQLQSESQEIIRATQVKAAAPRISGVDLDAMKYKEAMASMKAYYSEMETSVPKVNNLGGAFRKLTVDGNDAHSMARGLASGFNLLWLTWGNLLPLFTGAGISFGLKKTFDIGSEVEYMIKFMETLGQTVDHTGKKMADASGIIRSELRALDQTTIFSLTELSSAMVRLGQAGQTPAEALKTLRPAADLAAVGMVDLKTSTDLLIQTNALFNRSAADSTRTAAQIFQVTKSGVLNVEDIAGSMKYASEANTRFGKSLEETLTLLGALAQAGLKGSSGGTALINFYRDLNGRSGPAVRAMKELEKATGSTIKVFDELGNQRSGIDLFNDINEAANKLKAADADKLLAKIFSDRGGRTFFAMVRDGTIDLKKMQEELIKLDPTVLFQAAKGMMDTTRGALNILQGAMVGSLDQVFEAYSDKFKGFITDITKVVDSSEFKLAVAGIVEGVSSLYNTIKNNIGIISTFFGAWAGIKVVGTGIAIFQGISAALAGLAPTLAMTTGAYLRKTVAVQANSQAMIANVAAQRAAAAGMTATAAAVQGAAAASSVAAVSVGAAGVAMRGLGAVIAFLANPLVGLVATVGMLGYAFMSTKNSAESGMGGAATAVMQNGQIIEGQLLKEISLARQRNAIVGGGAFSDQEAKLNELSKGQANRAKQIQFLIDKSENTKFSEATRREAAILAKKEMETLKANDDALNRGRAEIAAGRLDQTKREEEDTNRAIEAGQKMAARAKAEAEAIALKGGGAGGRPAFEDFGKFKLAQDNMLAEMQKSMDSRLSVLKTGYDNEKQLTDAYYNAGLITQGSYEAKVLSGTLDYEAKSLAVVREANAEYLKAYDERAKVISEKLALANKSKNTSAIEQLSQALENLEQTKEGVVKGNLDKILQVEDAAMTRLRMSTIKADGELVKLAKNTNDYWKKDALEKSKAEALQQVADTYAIINESVLSTDMAQRAAAEAAVSESFKHASALEDLNVKLTEAEQHYQDFSLAILESGAYQTAEGQEALSNLQKRIDKLKELLTLSKTNSSTASQVAAQNAYDRAIQAQQKSLTNSITDAAVTGLTEGGEAGSKKLRDLVVNELKKPITMMIQAVVSPLVSGAFSLLGMGGGGGAAGGGAGGISSLIGMGQQGYSLYSGLSSGKGVMGTIGNWLGIGGGMNSAYGASAVGSYATPTGTAMMNAPATGGMSGLAGAGAFVATAGLVLNALGAFKSERKVAGGFSGTLGSGQISPWEEWREGGTLFSGPEYNTFNPVEELDKARAKLAKAQDSGDLRNVELQQLLVRNLEEQYSGLAETAAAQSRIIQKSFDTMRESAGTMAKALGLSEDKVKNFTTLLGGEKGVNLEGLNPEEQQAKIAEALATANNEIAQQLIGTWETTTKEVMEVVSENVGSSGEDMDIVFTQLKDTITNTRYVASEYARDGEKAIDTLTRLSTSMALVNETAAALGYGMTEVSLSAANAASNIVDAFGGVEAFTQTMGTYFENFYSDSEQKASKAAQVSRALSEVGFDIDASMLENSSRTAIRSFVESVGAQFGFESDQYVAVVRQANILSGITEALPTTTVAVEDTTSALSDAASEWQKVTDELLANRDALQIDLLRAMGDEEGALAAERKLAIVGFDAYQVGLWDANRATEKLIETLGKQKQVTEALAQLTLNFSSDATKEVIEYERISKALGKAGLDYDIETLMSADRDAIYQTALEFVNLSGASEDAKLSVIDAAQSLLTLKDSAKTLMESLISSAYSASDKYLSTGDAFKFKTSVLADRYAKEVEETSDPNRIAEITSMFQTATPEQIKAVTLQLLQFGNLSTKARLGLIDISTSLLDLVDTTEQATNAFKEQAQGIIEWVKNLAADKGGLASPEEELRARKSLYATDYEAAMAGDKDAISRITGTAQKYIDAQKVATASSDITETVISRIIAEMTALANKVGGGGFSAPAFEKGGYHSGGWAVVGEAGKELVNLGASRVYSNQDSRALLDMDPLIQEMRATRLSLEAYGNMQVQAVRDAAISNSAGQEELATDLSEAVGTAVNNAAWMQQSKPKLK